MKINKYGKGRLKNINIKKAFRRLSGLRNRASTTIFIDTPKTTLAAVVTGVLSTHF
jgi:hypothetical protein